MLNRFVICLCSLLLLSCGYPLIAEGNGEVVQFSSGDYEVRGGCKDHCEEDYKIRCKAYVDVYDKYCGFDTIGDARDWCKKIAYYWGFDFDLSDCKVYPADAGEPNVNFCAEYGPIYLVDLQGKGKKDVFKKYYDFLETHIYNGHFKVSTCIKFDKYCKAY